MLAKLRCVQRPESRKKLREHRVGTIATPGILRSQTREGFASHAIVWLITGKTENSIVRLGRRAELDRENLPYGSSVVELPCQGHSLGLC